MKIVYTKLLWKLVIVYLDDTRNTSGNCKDSLREDPRQWVDFSSASEKERSQEVSDSRNNRSSRQEFRTETRACHFCKHVGHLISQCRMRMIQEARENNYYTPPQMPRNQYTPIPRQYLTTYQNQGAYQQQPMIANPNWRPEARNQPIGTFGFGSTGKGIEANFAETIEEKSEVIKNEWSITLLPYGKSEIRIKRIIKKKDLIFEPYPETCQQFLIGLTNLFIPADKAQWIKIPIANTTEEPIYIPEDTIIEYLGMELENTLTPQKILNFPEIALYCKLTSINWQQLVECYQFTPEELAKLNIGTMDPDQQRQLKALILKYSDIFSRNGEFRRTNLVQHQIPTGDARPEKQCAYHVPPMEHNFIREEEKTKVATKTPNLTVLEFCRAIYTQNQSDLGLPEGCCPAESALTYYINARINYHIGKEEEPHDAKLGLYRELSQYTTKEVAVIAAIIVKIHREIEQYANENFSISTGNTRECANKTKENLETNQESNQQKLGTPAQTPKKTVTQSIKKQRIYSPEDKSYHFSPENKIQIPLGAASSSTSTPQTPRTPSYIDKIKQRNWGDIPITGGYSSLFQNPLFQPKFRMGFENREEESESESEKEISKKTITRPVTETSSQSRNQETHDQEKEPDIREATFRNTQGNIIPPSLRPINPSAENGNEMTTPYIVRLTDFSGEEEETDMHTWLREAQKAIQANNWNDQRAIQTLPFFLKGTADSWYQSLETKPTSFTEFKNALLEYFSNPNAIIQLQNEFNTIKQNTGETVTQYLARFNRIHHQIEAIEQGYYTDPQVLNQFIRELKSSILGRVRPAHPNSLPEAVTLARALESAEKEANHSQMVNMVMEENKTETLEKRVMRLGEELSKKIESYLIPDPRKNTYQPPQRRSQEVSDSRNNRSSRQEFRTETRACHFCKHVGHLISQCRMRMMQEARENNYYTPPQMPRNQYTPIPRQYLTTYQNQGAYQQQPMIANPNWRPEARNQPITKNSSKLSQTIPPAVATEDSSLAAIFPFELEENEAMFSGAALDEKCSITAMYMEATVNNTPIKLILDNGSAGSIVMLQLVNQLGFKVDRAVTSQIITADGSTKLPYGEIDSFPFEINGIVIPTKVLVIDATQYQALVGNDWLTKTNATLDWTTQELLINYNGHQAKIPATCGHFQKPSTNQRPTFEFEENPALPAIETYQLSWADDQRTGLPAVPMWTSEERSE
ncbi:hypothetical protein G9A89_019527 [Geosiphon pyriformis]|nr:hypothetical protein G9A89_019527 [Geosiphon pyriformis]